MSDPEELKLAAEFPAATREQWLALCARVLKGSPFETLTARTADGLAIQPLYARAPEAPRVGRSAPRWQVMTRVDHPDPAAANAQALEDLSGGANGLLVVGADSIGGYGYGLSYTFHTMERVLDGVSVGPDLAIEFDIGAQTESLPPDFLVHSIRVGFDPTRKPGINVRFGFDPLGEALSSGRWRGSWDLFESFIRTYPLKFVTMGFERALMVADGRIVHGAGGTEAQELAFVIAAAVTYLRALEAGGIALDDARRMIFFRLAADTDQFLTIAKFRALRKLWARIEESCGLVPEPAFISAETAWRMMTRNDPQVNILRAAIAAFAAGVGGADAITVLPFTAARGLPDAFARRIARNTGLILLDEANVARVADPTAGTGWSERLTDELCRTAWVLFQEIERAGGVAGALELGPIQKGIAAARAQRERAVATRTLALVGANEFPDLAEAPAAVLDIARVSVPAMPAAVPIEPLAPMRLAEPYEALRDASDRMLAANGARPKIFLANLGSAADFSARANLAKNLFAAGGIEAVANDGFVTRAEMLAAFKASGATLACLCASDAVYAREAVEAARALKAAGARWVCLVGQPEEREAELRQAGVDTLIHAGCDTLCILQEAHRALR